MKLEQKNILELYKSSITEMHSFLDGYYARLRFFMGILSALFAGSIAGILKSEQWYHFLLISIGPLLIVMISKIGIESVKRFYEDILDAISVRAKYEQFLGLTQDIDYSNLSASNNYWTNEPIIPERYLKSRRDYKSAKDWKKDHKLKGDQKWNMVMFYGAQIVGGLLLIVIILLAIKHF